MNNLSVSYELDFAAPNFLKNLKNILCKFLIMKLFAVQKKFKKNTALRMAQVFFPRLNFMPSHQ